jgi:hypothetical protein
MERIVHIVNGDSTADSLGLAELPGEIRVWADALDRGPLLPVGDAEHYRVRGDAWASRLGGSPADHAAKLAAYDRDFDEAAGAEELILWYEHDLFDQLALARLIARLSRRGATAHVTVVSIDRHPDVPTFVGLGQLTPTQLAELWPRRAPLSRDAIDEAVAAWIAITANDPRALPLLMRRIKAMPFLAGALERHLEDFPDPTSGLSRTERQVLAAIARGEHEPHALLAASHTGDPRYPLHDVALRDVLAALRACELITGEPAQITPHGRQALAGTFDRVHERGIDDWHGGVRLQGRGPVWRWDHRERRLSER